MVIDADLYRHTMSRFCTGVTVVTFKNEEGIHGLTVNAFTSVSLEPPLILICIQKNGISSTYVSECNCFVVNILSEEQKELANRFANPGLSSDERFRDIAFHRNKDGIPVFNKNLAHLECRQARQFDGGDHTIFLGEVEGANFSTVQKPLLFYNSTFENL